jgi:hypothetical protein
VAGGLAPFGEGCFGCGNGIVDVFFCCDLDFVGYEAFVVGIVDGNGLAAAGRPVLEHIVSKCCKIPLFFELTWPLMKRFNCMSDILITEKMRT